jgi:acetyl esterase
MIGFHLQGERGVALHPFIQSMLEKQRKLGRPAISAGSPQEARIVTATARAALGTKQQMAQVRDITIPTRFGTIPGRLFMPDGEITALIVYLHGGGWVVGELDDFDTLARELAKRTSGAVLLVDYRLAPEHPYPAGLQDCEEALLFAADTRALIGHHVPLVVAGDSAGGNLATVVARNLRGRVKIAMQVLIYPVTDCDLDTPSYRSESDGMPISRADMQWFFDHYAEMAVRTDPDISPLRATNLGGMPPAFILTSEHDVLRDEGEAYAEKLRQSGNSVELRRYHGAPHGFIRLHNLYETADQAITDIGQAISRVTARG